MKIAITGAGGFLGTEILRQLSVNENILIYAFTFEFERQRTTFIKSENIIPVDNSEAGSFDFSDVDILLNCAFPRNVDDASFAAGLDYIQTILMKAVADGVGAVVNISSQSVYSQKRTEKADESSPIVLESKYAVGKYASELLVNSICAAVSHTNLRMASLIGVGFNQRITNKFAEMVKNGAQITITGGSQLFGFLDVRDAASAIIALMMADPVNWKEVYNLGTNSAYSLREIAEEAITVGKKMGYTAPELIVNESDDWQNSSLDCSLFHTDFAWQPEYSISATMESLFEAI